MSKFLADTTTIKFLVIFLISELMFFSGLKKKLRPGEKFCFTVYPAAACKGLRVYMDGLRKHFQQLEMCFPSISG
jgi:hypothetical protein